MDGRLMTDRDQGNQKMIDRYLANHLNDTERELVETRIVGDPGFRHEVELTEALRDGLVRQISGAVRWEATMALLLKQGVSTFIELGPGKVLGGLAKRQAKEAGIEVTAFNIGAPEDLAQLG